MHRMMVFPAAALILAAPLLAQDSGTQGGALVVRSAQPLAPGDVQKEVVTDDELELRQALVATISRQLRQHWEAPEGAQEITTMLAWTLAPDGSLRGTPRVVSQTGVTRHNRKLGELHEDAAIRAVELASPFTLPHDKYALWSSLSFRFDQRM